MSFSRTQGCSHLVLSIFSIKSPLDSRYSPTMIAIFSIIFFFNCGCLTSAHIILQAQITFVIENLCVGQNRFVKFSQEKIFDKGWELLSLQVQTVVQIFIHFSFTILNISLGSKVSSEYSKGILQSSSQRTLKI